MAEFMPMSSKIRMSLDSGEVINGKAVYRKISVSAKAGLTPEKVVNTAAALGGLLALPVDKCIYTENNLAVN